MSRAEPTPAGAGRRPSVNETAVAIAGSGSGDAVGRLLRNRNLLLLTAWAVMLVGGQYVRRLPAPPSA